MLDPCGVIIVDSPAPEAYLSKLEDTACAASVVATTDLTHIQRQLKEEAPHSKRENPTSTFKPMDNTREIRVDPKDPSKVICIGAGLSSELEAPLTKFLYENADVFVWTPYDIPNILHDVVDHCININLEARLVQQRLRCFNKDR
jgi:hypothetical protein